jgi:hypothetical protein
MVTHDSEKSRGIRSDFVTIMTVGEGEPAKNQGSEGADAPEIGYLLIPSCESRVRLRNNNCCRGTTKDWVSIVSREGPGGLIGPVGQTR